MSKRKLEALLLGSLLGGSGSSSGTSPYKANDQEAKRRLASSPNALFRTVHKWRIKNGWKFETTRMLDKITKLLGTEEIRKNIDAKDSEGTTALFHAVRLRLNKVARLLVEAGADPIGTTKANSPIRTAFMGCKGEVGAGTRMFLAWLLTHIEGTPTKERAVERLSNTLSMMNIICKRKREEYTTVQLLLRYGMDANGEGADTGVRPLHFAAGRGHPGIMKLLIEAGADINAVDNNGHTPLHDAVFHGKVDTAILLLQHGARTDIESGEREDEPIISRRTAAELADIRKNAMLASIIRGWAYWNGQSPTPVPAAPSETRTRANDDNGLDGYETEETAAFTPTANDDDDDANDAEGGPKKKKKKKQKITVPAMPTKISATDKWECVCCCEENSESEATCSTCLVPRPSKKQTTIESETKATH